MLEELVEKRMLVAVIFSIFLLQLHAQSEEWKQAAGPLKTRWSKDVSPSNALPEYPRPVPRNFLKSKVKVVDEVTSYFGMRKIELGKMKKDE